MEVHNPCTTVKQLIYRLNAATQHNDVGEGFPIYYRIIILGQSWMVVQSIIVQPLRPINTVRIHCTSGGVRTGDLGQGVTEWEMEGNRVQLQSKGEFMANVWEFKMHSGHSFSHWMGQSARSPPPLRDPHWHPFLSSPVSDQLQCQRNKSWTVRLTDNALIFIYGHSLWPTLCTQLSLSTITINHPVQLNAVQIIVCHSGRSEASSIC